MENDERVAEVLYGMLNVICKKNLLPTGTSGNFHRMLGKDAMNPHFSELPVLYFNSFVSFFYYLVHYGTYLYSITLSNRKFHIVKRKYQPAEPVVV